MHTSVSVITPATSISLVSVDEAKLALNLTTSTDMNTQDQIAMFIEWSSGKAAAICDRTFAEETVVETFFELEGSRLPLSHYPVTVINSVTENDVELTTDDYNLDAETGILTRIDTTWTVPIVVDYTGGYKLPVHAPAALKQAALLLTREAYQAAIRGDATVRMVAHKESRIIYFDPNAKAGAAGQVGNVGSATERAVNDLLMRFRRIPI